MAQNFQNDYTRVNSFLDFNMLYNVYGSKSYINVGHTEGTSSEIKFMGENAEISTIGPYGDRLRLKAVRD